MPDPVIFEEEIKKLTKEKFKSKLKFNNNSFFLSIGRLTKQKNHELLISLYKKYEIKEKLVIIGDGELKDHLLKLAEEEGSNPEINDQSKYLIDQKIEVIRSLN